MIQIIETGMNGRRTLIDTAPSFAEAKAKVAEMGVCHMEDDSDYPDCADAYMTDGRCLAIQPEGFTLKVEAEYKKGQSMAAERRAALDDFDSEFGIK